jgi:parallel beta-helix repeat protein
MKRRILSLALRLALLAGLLGTGPVQVRATGFEVNSNADGADAHDSDLNDGDCADSQGRCTLRAAIEQANNRPGADTITFANSMYIQVDTTVGALPAITEQLRIEASSVWNTADDQPGVTLNGANQSLPGLFLSADNCEVYGLFLINFTHAIDIRSAYNTIGNPVQGEWNVISSNGGYGVSIYGPAAHHNVVSGNLIGLSITGDSKQPNLAGVYISGGAYENTIGGDVLGKGNVISGNTQQGIAISGANSDGNRLGANYIGLPLVDPSQDMGNGGAGVHVFGGPQNTQIGSSGSDLAGNWISFNGSSGVTIWDAHNNGVESNVITGNKGDGVYVRDGAGNFILSNEIASNAQDGVGVSGATANQNRILANSIHDNGYRGIDLSDGGNTELPAPTITTADADGAAGTGCAGCTVHVFSDSADEGETYQGFASVDASGTWIYSGTLAGPNVTATNTDGDGNTSEFSTPYTINQPPNMPSNPSPTDGATGVALNTSLSWTGGDPDAGDTVTYTIHFGTVNPPPLAQSGLSTTSYSPTLSANTSYYWKIVAQDHHGATTSGMVWDFTTGSQTQPKTKAFLPIVLRNR